MNSILVLFVFSFIAAFFGTVAMTVSQEIEIRLNRRPISYTPAIAVFNLLGLDFDRLEERLKGIASYAVHFAYGTVWGFPLVFFVIFDVTNAVLILVLYYIVILLQGWITLPLLGIAGPPWTWGLKPLLTEAFHKLIYSLATFYSFTLLLHYYYG